MKKAIIGSAAILTYVNIIPYACRIWRGLDWVGQYLPDNKDQLISGLLFVGIFASLPAIPLAVTFLLRKRIPVTFVLSIIVATTLLCLWHHNYDLASDAQAAIGLMFIPIMATMLTSVVAGIIGTIEFFVRRERMKAMLAIAVIAVSLTGCNPDFTEVSRSQLNQAFLINSSPTFLGYDYLGSDASNHYFVAKWKYQRDSRFKVNITDLVVNKPMPFGQGPVEVFPWKLTAPAYEEFGKIGCVTNTLGGGLTLFIKK